VTEIDKNHKRRVVFDLDGVEEVRLIETILKF